MKVALIDNGSLEPAAHAGLRAAAAALGEDRGIRGRGRLVEAQRPDPAPRTCDGGPAWTLAPWIRAQVCGRRAGVRVRPVLHQPAGRDRLAPAQGPRVAPGAKPGASTSRSRRASRQRPRPRCHRRGPRARGDCRRRAPPARRHRRRPRRPVARLRGGPRTASRTRCAGRLGGSIGPLAAASMESPDGPAVRFQPAAPRRGARGAGIQRGRRRDRPPLPLAGPARRPRRRPRADRPRPRRRACPGFAAISRDSSDPTRWPPDLSRRRLTEALRRGPPMSDDGEDGPQAASQERAAQGREQLPARPHPARPRGLLVGHHHRGQQPAHEIPRHLLPGRPRPARRSGARRARRRPTSSWRGSACPAASARRAVAGAGRDRRRTGERDAQDHKPAGLPAPRRPQGQPSPRRSAR